MGRWQAHGGLIDARETARNIGFHVDDALPKLPEATVIDRQLLDILACPETREPVSLADEALVASLNRKIEAGQLVNRAGEKVTEPISAGLVREDGRYLYAIRDDIPIMLVEQGIPLE